MENKTQFTQKWLAHSMSNCPSFIIEKRGRESVQDILLHKIAQDFAYTKDEKWAKSIYDYCKIEGSQASDFLYRNLHCSLGDMVCSIRFVGGDLTKPAVFILHKDFALKKTEDIQVVAQYIKEEYQIFQPKRIRWFSLEEDIALIKNNERINGDSVYIAGFIEEMPLTFLKKNEIRLEKIANLVWYSTYENEYNEMLKADPLFAEMGEMTTKETFEDLRKQNLAFSIFINDEWAGVIAASKENHSFFQGYEIYEEFLLKKYRRQNYAPTLQRLLIEKLDKTENNMLWGTIHHENIASLKTALKNERKKCGMYLFFTL